MHVFVVNILKVFTVGFPKFFLETFVSIPLCPVITCIIIYFMYHFGVCIVVGDDLEFCKSAVSLSHYETFSKNKL